MSLCRISAVSLPSSSVELHVSLSEVFSIFAPIVVTLALHSKATTKHESHQNRQAEQDRQQNEENEHKRSHEVHFISHLVDQDLRPCNVDGICHRRVEAIVEPVRELDGTFDFVEAHESIINVHGEGDVKASNADQSER